METVELECEKRNGGTKGDIRALRRDGRVPGVMYGPKRESTPVTVSAAELRARVSAASRQRLIKIKSSAADLNERHVIIKQIQRAPVSGDILHADFYEVDLKQRIRVGVALKFTGRAKGVADGGILQPLVRQVEVECLPLEIPESIEVDVAELGIHDVIHVSALKVAGNYKPIFDQDFAIVSVLPPTVEEAPTPAAAVAEEGAPVEGAPAEGAAAPAAGAAAPAEGKEGAAGAAPAAAGGKKEPAKK